MARKLRLQYEGAIYHIPVRAMGVVRSSWKIVRHIGASCCGHDALQAWRVDTARGRQVAGQ